MTARRIVERNEAVQDIEAATDYYLVEGGEAVAIGFLNALEAAYRDIAEHPALGSPRYGDVLAIVGLRGWRLGRYPYIVLNVDRDERVEVWRVIHGRRDLPPLLRDAE